MHKKKTDIESEKETMQQMVWILQENLWLCYIQKHHSYRSK